SISAESKKISGTELSIPPYNTLPKLFPFKKMLSKEECDQIRKASIKVILIGYCPICRENHMSLQEPGISIDEVLEAYTENSEPIQELKTQCFTSPIPWNNALKFPASIILDTTTWKTAKLPDIPGPPRHYPLTAGTTLLPLSPDNNYDPEVLVCGGSNRNPKVINDGYGEKSCGRISPLSANPKWSMEDMEYGRIMPDIVLMADGNTLILNGCSRGIAGFDIGKDPILVPVIYKPNGVKGSRMETMQPSYIPRMYHSIAFTIPSSQVLVSGSNPNSKVTETSAFPTEYRVEIFSPPFLFTGLPQPEITNAPKTLKYGQKFQIDVTIYKGDNKPKITSNLLNSGFVTHSTHMSQRQIFLEVVEHNENTGKLTLKAPPGSGVAPPGPYLLFVVSDGVPSVGVWVRV
ncbi:7469_t:CDS:2, partial [Entrophospora sp. SA101]